MNFNGNIIVSDSRNNRIQIFDSKGNFILTFGSLGEENGQCKNPHGICVDLNDNILVCDYDNYRIQIFDSNGKYMSQLNAYRPADIVLNPKTLEIIVSGFYCEAVIF